MENGHEMASMEQHSGSDSSSPTIQPSQSSEMTSELKFCFGCQQPIVEECRLRVSPDLEWHAECLVCAECQISLDETCTCFIKNGKTYCKKDYVRLFGVPCSACRQPIKRSDYIMRARDQVYHLKCFACSQCGVGLQTGEYFGFHEGKLYCKSHFNSLHQDKANDLSSVDNGNSQTRRSQPPTTNSTGGRTKRSNSEKGPRVRTVLSEQQLQTLRSVYTTNPRPDALLKEHLVEITGLSPRVIRVWFQNKRCKDKKKMIHAQEQARQQQALQQQHGGAPTTIPPLTPQTPLTPDSISPHHSMSAFTYPPVNFEPSQPSVSPIATYHQHTTPYNTSTETLAHFDVNVQDYTSPSLTPAEHQTFIQSSVANSTQVTPYF